MYNFIFIFILFSSLGCSMFGISKVEELKYKVILKEDNKEIRFYEDYIIAQVTVDTDGESENSAFRILAGYIFGGNTSKSKIAMTAPVITNEKSASESIKMTAPVLIESSEKNKMTMSFSMPSKYKLNDLPEPKDQRIQLLEVPSHLMAVYKFSGFWNSKKNAKLSKKLTEWLNTQPSYEPISEPYFAGYNPPWTLPFLRRNEILIKIKKIESTSDQTNKL